MAIGKARICGSLWSNVNALVAHTPAILGRARVHVLHKTYFNVGYIVI